MSNEERSRAADNHEVQEPRIADRETPEDLEGYSPEILHALLDG
jgi:hypothetical protein